MRDQIAQPLAKRAWELVERQHGVITRSQLLELGYSPKAIKHRVATGRLHRVRPGIYAAGRPKLTLHGRWHAALLACGPEAALSHASAAALWKLCPPSIHRVEVSVPRHARRRAAGVLVHR